MLVKCYQPVQLTLWNTVCSSFWTGQDPCEWVEKLHMRIQLQVLRAGFHLQPFNLSQYLVAVHSEHALPWGFWKLIFTQIYWQKGRRKTKATTLSESFHLKCSWKCLIRPCMHLDSSFIHLCIFSERQTAESSWYQIHSFTFNSAFISPTLISWNTKIQKPHLRFNWTPTGLGWLSKMIAHNFNQCENDHLISAEHLHLYDYC